MIKKILFYLSAFLAIVFLVRVAIKLFRDLDRLTEFGYGYLTGEIILFFVFGTIMFLTRKSVFKSAEKI